VIFWTLIQNSPVAHFVICHLKNVIVDVIIVIKEIHVNVYYLIP